MDREFQIKFDEEISVFLVDKLGETCEEDCRYAALALIRLSIDIIFQNAPNKENFAANCEAIFSRILTLFLEAKNDR